MKFNTYAYLHKAGRLLTLGGFLCFIFADEPKEALVGAFFLFGGLALVCVEEEKPKT